MNTTTKNLKKYKVIDPTRDFEVVLEVDHDILTPAVAEQINKFYSGWESRVEEKNGSHTLCVIQLAGEFFMNAMLKHGGTLFPASCIEAAAAWTSDLSSEDGWPKEHGIRVVSAIVEVPEYDCLEMTEL